MVDTNSWDWDTGEKVLADTSSWKDKFEWVEEFQASPLCKRPDLGKPL